ncbi:hypothetical protein [Stappia sp.]|uniref:hypothetical protein n=1 Tax=Stappia sp. TaxID=1870903 RepID=UPI0025F9E876|nr:hypothetical protein [Stappia sp.]
MTGRLCTRSSWLCAALSLVVVGGTATMTYALDDGNYCPIKDFIVVCLGSDGSRDEVMQSLRDAGWSVRPGSLVRSSAGIAAQFSLTEVRFSDVVYQSCGYQNWTAATYGVSTFCGPGDFQQLEAWIQAHEHVESVDAAGNEELRLSLDQNSSMIASFRDAITKGTPREARVQQSRTPKRLGAGRLKIENGRNRYFLVYDVEERAPGKVPANATVLQSTKVIVPRAERSGQQ